MVKVVVKGKGSHAKGDNVEREESNVQKIRHRLRFWVAVEES